MKRTAITILILIIGCVYHNICAESLHWNQGRGYEIFKYGGNNGIYFDNKTDTLQYDFFLLEYPVVDFSLKFRAANLHGNPTKKYPYYDKNGKILNQGNPHWGFFIKGDKEIMAVSVKTIEKMTIGEPEPALEIAVYDVKRSRKESVTLTKGINPYTGDNLWSLELAEDKINISAGDYNLTHIVSSLFKDKVDGFGFFAGWGDELLISDISVNFNGEKERNYMPGMTLPDMEKYFQESDDSMEGYWTLFDRELEENLLKMGGNYNLACFKEGENYIFYYLNGASINSKEWNNGDVKAILSPSPFEGVYDVEWFDAMKEPLKKDIKAQAGEGYSLTVLFPYQSSKIRLRKIPKEFSDIKL